MSEEFGCALVLLAILLFALAFCGSPDLHDALIHHLMEKS